jgi:hypothetical protein
MIIEIMRGLCWIAGAMIIISIVVIAIGDNKNDNS